MTASATTLAQYSRLAAQAFVQTAIFIDDRIFETPRATIATKIAAPRARKPAVRRVAAKGDQAIPENAVPEEGEVLSGPDTYDIVNSFAKKQIICSPYQPKPEHRFSDKSDIFHLCRPADVVIVDWDLFGDHGERATELIDGLIRQAVDDIPEQLRLVIIYTQELNLLAVANAVFERLQQTLGDAIDLQDNGLSFHTPNSRFTVLGKPGRDRPDIAPDRVVAETDLADATVKEFAALASGLLQSATLLGLAQIRQNSRKILSKFSAKLDPAFITHLAMNLPNEDASEHVVPLLVDEIQSVLEDALPHPLITQPVLIDWLNTIWTPGDHLIALLGAQANIPEIAQQVVEQGFKEARRNDDRIPKPDKDNAASFFMTQADDPANHLFAHLMASRTFYEHGSRSLQLGAVLKREHDNQYLICLQPICDSVRINGNRAFLFATLDAAENAKFNHVVLETDGRVVELSLQAKAYNSLTISFASGANQIVQASRTEAGEYIFSDISGARYSWVDQLKVAHAQRAIGNLASDISRVGLTESEWLRARSPDRRA